jgi:hypothetical protein
MTLFPVRSGNLHSAGYDETARQLVVRFHNGKRFRYMDVPPEKYAGIFEAPSAGRYFATEIRPYHTSVREDERTDVPEALD